MSFSGLVGYPNYKPPPPPPPGPLYPVHPNWLFYLGAGLWYGLHVLNNDEQKRNFVETEGKFLNIKVALDNLLPLVDAAETTIR